MKKEIEIAVAQLGDASNRLKEGVADATDELDKDGVIQRFEFTFEMLWKCLKQYLAGEGITCNTPRECLKSAFKIGLIEDEETFLDMLEDRNKTSHIYSREESEDIFERVCGRYQSQIEAVLRKLKEKIESDGNI